MHSDNHTQYAQRPLVSTAGEEVLPHRPTSALRRMLAAAGCDPESADVCSELERRRVVCFLMTTPYPQSQLGRSNTMAPHEYHQLRKKELATTADDEVLLTARQVCAKLGGISLMSLHRWLGRDAVQFPRPTLRINNRRYWSSGSIRRWLAERGSDEVTA
jgi:hypothetical protein